MQKFTFRRFWEQKNPPVVISSYETLVSQDNQAKGGLWDLIIFDEAHRLKNGKNQTSKALRGLSSKARILLTGTPTQNNLTEYFEVIDFMNPGALGSKKGEFA